MANTLDTKRLRQKLLDLAVRGKLVPQDPNDEPASELLARIHDEKLEMVKRGELKSKDVKNDTVIYYASDGLPYEKPADGRGEPVCIEGEIPFEIPETWAWARLGGVVNVVSARRVHKEDWRKQGVPFYRAREIVKLANGDAIENPLYIEKSLYEKLAKSGLPEPGDLMVTGVGTIGISYIVKPEDTFYYKDASVLCFENRFGMLAGYLQLLLGSDFFINQVHDASAGTTVDTITIKNATTFLLPVPPLAEQRRIVAALDRCLSLVDTVERDGEELGALFGRLRSKVLDLAIRGELTERDPSDEPAGELLARIRDEKLEMVKRGELKPKDVKGDTVIFTGSDGLRYEKRADGRGEPVCIEDEIPFEIPETWAWARLGSIGLPQTKRIPSGDTFNYIDIGNIDNKRHAISGPNIINVKNAPSRASRAVHKHSTVFSMVRPYLQNIAFVSDRYKDSVASTGFYVISPVGATFNPRCLYYFMLSEYAIGSVNSHMKGDNSPSVRKEDMEGLILPIPPAAEQQNIVQKVENILSQFR